MKTPADGDDGGAWRGERLYALHSSRYAYVHHILARHANEKPRIHCPGKEERRSDYIEEVEVRASTQLAFPTVLKQPIDTYRRHGATQIELRSPNTTH